MMTMQTSMLKNVASGLQGRQSVASRPQSVRLSHRQMRVQATGSDPKVIVNVTRKFRCVEHKKGSRHIIAIIFYHARVFRCASRVEH